MEERKRNKMHEMKLVWLWGRGMFRTTECGFQLELYFMNEYCQKSMAHNAVFERFKISSFVSCVGDPHSAPLPPRPSLSLSVKSNPITFHTITMEIHPIQTSNFKLQTQACQLMPFWVLTRGKNNEQSASNGPDPNRPHLLLPNPPSVFSPKNPFSF